MFSQASPRGILYVFPPFCMVPSLIRLLMVLRRSWSCQFLSLVFPHGCHSFTLLWLIPWFCLPWVASGWSVSLLVRVKSPTCFRLILVWPLLGVRSLPGSLRPRRCSLQSLSWLSVTPCCPLFLALGGPIPWSSLWCPCRELLCFRQLPGWCWSFDCNLIAWLFSARVPMIAKSTGAPF